MATVSVNLQTDDWKRAIRALRAKAPARIARAVNRSATSTQAVMAREVARDMGLKVGTAKQAMKLDKATGSRLSAEIEATGAQIPLSEFGAKGPLPSYGRGRGVTAKMQGSRRRYPHAFMARVGSHVGVFARSPDTRGPRLPIIELHGPSIPLVFGKKSPLGMERGNEAMVKNLTHEMEFLLQQVSGK